MNESWRQGVFKTMNMPHNYKEIQEKAALEKQALEKENDGKYEALRKQLVTSIAKEFYDAFSDPFHPKQNVNGQVKLTIRTAFPLAVFPEDRHNIEPPYHPWFLDTAKLITAELQALLSPYHIKLGDYRHIVNENGRAYDRFEIGFPVEWDAILE